MADVANIDFIDVLAFDTPRAGIQIQLNNIDFIDVLTFDTTRGAVQIQLNNIDLIRLPCPEPDPVPFAVRVFR